MTIEEIKKHLPHGAMVKVANELGLSRTTVGNILNGKSTSPRRFEVLHALEKEIINRRNGIQ